MKTTNVAANSGKPADLESGAETMQGHNGSIVNKNQYGEAGNRQPLEVLLTEDSPGDIRLTREAFKAVNASVRLSVATDGVEALAFLRREGVHAVPLGPILRCWT